MQANTYLTFDGNCAEAFKVYEKVLGGKIIAMMTHKDRRPKPMCLRHGATRSCMPASSSATTC